MSSKEPDIEKTMPVEVPAEKTMLIQSGREGSGVQKKQTGNEHKNLIATFWGHTVHLLGRTQNVSTILPDREKISGNNVVTNLNDLEQVTLEDVSEHFSVDPAFAAGRQGVVSKGRDRILKRMVAVKSLRKELCENEGQRKNFLTEARVTAQLDHPAIVPVYGLHSQKDNGLAVSMKLVQGHTLKEYMEYVSRQYSSMKRRRQYDEHKNLRYRLEIFLKICDALEYAHNRNIMHCDLKPENIMIGEYHEAYLMDWGIAKKIKPEAVIGAEQSADKENVCCTPRFLAPERLRGEYGDARSDIFSMGLILYELVSFSEAFTGCTAEEIVRNVANYKISPLKHRFDYPIDDDLKAIVRKAAAFHASDRYSSMKAFSDDIRKYLNNEEVSANPDNTFWKIFRFCFLRHGKTTAMATLFVLFSFAVFGAFEFWQRLDQEKKEKRRQVRIGLQFSESMQAASEFDREVAIWERELIYATEKIYFLMRHEHSAYIHEKRADALCPFEKYNNPDLAPPTYRLYEPYGMKLDFDRIAYHMAPDTPEKTVEQRLNVATNMLWTFQNLLISTPFNMRLYPDNRDKLLLNMMSSKVPGFQAYYAFEDGSYFSYPGKSNDPDYDPRKRGWYKNRIKPDVPYTGWSAPYLDYHEKQTLITFSARLENETGTPVGVVALDIDLKIPLGELIGDIKEKPFILEKTFLDSQGGIIMTTNEKLNEEAAGLHRAKRDGSAELFKYPDSDLTARMLQYSQGSISRTEKDRPVIYTFAKCRTVNWYYFEKIDVRSMLEYYETNRFK